MLTDFAIASLAFACCSAVLTPCSAMRVCATWASSALAFDCVLSSSLMTGMITDSTSIWSPIWSRMSFVASSESFASVGVVGLPFSSTARAS